MQEWRKYKLGELLKFSNGRTSPNRSEKLPFPVFGSNGLIGFSNKHNIEGDAIIIGRVGSYCGSLYYAKNPCWITDNAIKAIARNNNNPKYLFFLLKSINLNYYKGGSGQPLLNQATLNAIEAWSTSNINEQYRIAEILGTLDDKIELNLEMNKTLEEMAMAIYKEWFVDFGPFRDGEFVDSELGLIPKGWEVMKIDEAIETLGGGTPKTSVKEYWETGEIIWYSPTDLTKTNSLFSLGSEKKITSIGLQKSSAKLFPPYSLLMTSRATIGAITINRYEACTNQGFITLVPNKQFTVYQLFGWLHQNMDTINNLANGSTFREISKGVFREFKILKAVDIDNYFKMSKPIFDQIENNLIENNTLTETRDYLLSKLISGEVRVKTVEEKLKEVL